MSKSKITFDEIRSNIKKRHPEESKFRCQGYSTRSALRAISEAYSTPGAEIEIHDHYGTPQAHKHLESMIRDYIDRLGFSGFEFNKRRGKTYLRYKLTAWKDL